jgi:hypothetical protein
MKKRRTLEPAGSRTLASEEDHCTALASEPDTQSPETVEKWKAQKTGVLSRQILRGDLDVSVKLPLGRGSFEASAAPCGERIPHPRHRVKLAELTRYQKMRMVNKKPDTSTAKVRCSELKLKRQLN